MGCNCRKNRVVYTGPPPQPASESTSHTGGQPPINNTVVAGGQANTSSR